MDLYILDQNGEPAACEDVIAWAAWWSAANRQVAEDRIKGVRISTVFLGIDHNLGDGPPLLWETLVFGGALGGELKRYATREEALAGHAAMLARVLASEALS
jgi:hypothetical protein